MIQEGPEDQGNPVKEFGRSWEVQKVQGGLSSLRRSRKSLEVKSNLKWSSNTQWGQGGSSGVLGDLDGTYLDEICPFSISSSSGLSTLL